MRLRERVRRRRVTPPPPALPPVGLGVLAIVVSWAVVGALAGWVRRRPPEPPRGPMTG